MLTQAQKIAKFRLILLNEICTHQMLQPQDVAKFCYQAALGAEHMLVSGKITKLGFSKEYKNTEEDGEVPMMEIISTDYCRINLAAWKFHKMSKEALYNAFLETANRSSSSQKLLRKYLDIVKEIVKKTHLTFSVKDWSAYLRRYKKAGMPAVRHSDTYRELYKPAYRVIDMKIAKEIMEKKKQYVPKVPRIKRRKIKKEKPIYYY